MEGISRQSSPESEQNTKQQISNSMGTLDYMDYIPRALVFVILPLVPLHDLVKMSLLSKQWERSIVDFLSTAQPSLHLSEGEMIKRIAKQGIYFCSCKQPCSYAYSYQRVNHIGHVVQQKFSQFVDRALLLLFGCNVISLRLSLYYYAIEGCITSAKIDNWVHYALTNDIKELEFNFCEGNYSGHRDWEDRYEMPHGHFAPKTLETLILNFCEFRLSNFQVFTSLRSLSLIKVLLHDCTLGELVSRCLVLEDVTLENCVVPYEFMVSKEDVPIRKLSLVNCEPHNWPTYPINISTPALQQLKLIDKYIMQPQFRKATEFMNVFFDIQQNDAEPIEAEGMGFLLIGLKHCRSLQLAAWGIQVLPAVEILFEEGLHPFQNLTHLKLKTGLTKQDLPGISCLLRRCPCLEVLELRILVPPSIIDLDDFRPSILQVYNFEEEVYGRKRVIHLNV